MNDRSIDWLMLSILSLLMCYNGGVPILWGTATTFSLVCFWVKLYMEWRNERD